ncbi:probable oligoribonuclease isoform X1 [Camponotus floridanus]|uniref:probable oligoribonuclease isoform X1 n=1 Tax=Camponotus floridanus TaxID=104421 RepID=UPI00059C11B6|nr:probable oligoribonuclease isoform X1 [Camponotus floridanus]
MTITRFVKHYSKYMYHSTRRYLNNDRTTPTVIRRDDKNEKHIVWLDMEMTGLEVEQCHILELACLITDEQLKPVSDCLNIIIHQTDQVLENMSNWCKVQHKKSGLINDCRSSKVTLEEAQQKMLQYLQSHVPRGMCPLAGNSIYMDRIFLRKYMPLIDNYLHYRVIDVSTIKELARRWQPNIDKAVPKKRYCHRAAIDIKDSLNELYYYKNHLFVIKE